MGKRGEKVCNNNTWTEAQFWGHFKSALRWASVKWLAGGVYAKALRKLLKDIPVELRGMSFTHRGKLYEVTGRETYLYPCEFCKLWFSEKAVDKDHIVPCGGIHSFENIGEVAKRMFIEAEEGWRLLCKPCHKRHSAEQQAERKKL